MNKLISRETRKYINKVSIYLALSILSAVVYFFYNNYTSNSQSNLYQPVLRNLNNTISFFMFCYLQLGQVIFSIVLGLVVGNYDLKNNMFSTEIALIGRKKTVICKIVSLAIMNIFANLFVVIFGVFIGIYRCGFGNVNIAQLLVQFLFLFVSGFLASLVIFCISILLKAEVQSSIISFILVVPCYKNFGKLNKYMFYLGISKYLPLLRKKVFSNLTGMSLRVFEKTNTTFLIYILVLVVLTISTYVFTKKTDF